MAFENLFIRTKRILNADELDTPLQFDAVIEESHSNTVRVTKNPVEFGADISDHVIIEPKKLTMFAVVSDTPLGVPAFTEIIDTITGSFGSSTEENITRSQQAYKSLIKLQESKALVQIQTKLVLYNDMIIASVSTKQDKDTSRKVDFNIVFEEALIVDTETIEFPPESLFKGSTKDQASSTKKAGKKEALVPSDNENKSLLKSLSDSVSKLISDLFK